MTLNLIVGGYQGKIITLEFDPTAKSLAKTSTTTANGLSAPSWLEFSNDGKTLYALDEEDPSGRIHTFAFDPTQSSSPLKHVRSTPSGGTSPCHTIVYPSGPPRLITSNYSGSTVSSLPASLPESGPEEGTSRQVIDLKGVGQTGPNKERQDASHPHGIELVPGREGEEDFIVVPDLGTDELRIFRVSKEGELTALERFKVKAGDGPRHAVFSALKHVNDGLYTVMYVMNELSNSISIYHLALPPSSDTSSRSTSSPNSPTIILVVPNLSLLPSTPFPPEPNFNKWHSSELSLSPCGSQLWGSNRSEPHNPLHVDLSRGANDLLVKWELDPSTGLPAPSEDEQEPQGKRMLFDCGGRTPRHFEFHRRGEWLAVAMQDSDELVVFATGGGRNHGGERLVEMARIRGVGYPAVVRWLD